QGEGRARLGSHRSGGDPDARGLRGAGGAAARRGDAQRRHDPGSAHAARGPGEGRASPMATWPDLTEYHEALQHPQRSLGDPELQRAQIEKDRFGMPKPATGGNAVVYKATEGQNVWAVRCFLRPISDHAERYAAISKHLGKNRSAHSTKFFYLADGLRIKGGAFPIVKMAWVQGPNLDRFVESSLDQPKQLAALREKFRTLVNDVEAAKFAHGDLQHGNILVSG